MNELILTNTMLPVFSGGDHLAAAAPFYHADRTADFHVLIYVTQGCIYVTEDNVDYEIKSGELLFLKSGVHHMGKKMIEKGTSWYFVHFIMDQPEGTVEFFPDFAPIPQYTDVRMHINLPKMVTGLTGTELEKQIEGFTEYIHGNDPMKKWEINNRLYGLLCDIAFWGKRKTEVKNVSDRICIYLSQHWQEPFEAEQLEREFFLSYKRLAAVFKRDKGMSMQQFHTELRMKNACQLLRSTLLSVGEIAAKSGFSDSLYFSKVFHKSMGMSPSQYRKQIPKW